MRLARTSEANPSEVRCIPTGTYDVSLRYSCPSFSLVLNFAFLMEEHIACDDTTFVSSIVSKHTTEGYGLGRRTIA